MQKRFFTVQEANDLIPFLTPRLHQIRSAYAELKNTWAKRVPDLQEVMRGGGMPVDLRHYHLLSQLHKLSAEICATGCYAKDPEEGLIDFPTLWEGREVYLCWKLGEPKVEFWHETDAGYAGRQPLKNGPVKNTPDSGC